MGQIVIRNNVKITGVESGPTVILAHGFGCDQTMWRFILPQLEKHFRVVLFDYVGSGQSLLTDYSVDKYSSLEGYAEDILDIIDELQLEDVTLVGHSVSAMIGSIAFMAKPDLIKRIVMVCPSPCFLNIPPDYQGGFQRGDLKELIGLMDRNYIGWAEYLAPLVMGGSQSPALIGELSGSFCSTDPVVAKTFANATFFSDYRHLLPKISCPVLMLQSSSDALADVSIGKYMAQQLPQSELAIIDAEGHCLHMTNPETISPIVVSFIQQDCNE